MARESKGQQVKTFKHFVPMPNLSYEETVGKVYFQAKDGLFAIHLPEHIAAVADGLPAADSWYETKGVRRLRSEIFAPTIDAVTKSYDYTLKAYRKLIETQQREKVIKVEFASNIRHIEEFHGRRRNEFIKVGGMRFDARSGGISFVGSPAIHLKYEVLYRVGNALYRVHDVGTEDETMQHHATIKKDDPMIVPWTAEAEAFFAATVANIERLIMAMIEFFDDMPANLQLAIENGGQLKLPPAPTTEKE